MLGNRFFVAFFHLLSTTYTPFAALSDTQMILTMHGLARRVISGAMFGLWCFCHLVSLFFLKLWARWCNVRGPLANPRCFQAPAFQSSGICVEIGDKKPFGPFVPCFLAASSYNQSITYVQTTPKRAVRVISLVPAGQTEQFGCATCSLAHFSRRLLAAIRLDLSVTSTVGFDG